MRLIETATGMLKEFANDNEVKYAILSHRWEDEEVSLRDYDSAAGRAKKGFAKIQCASEEARKMNLHYLWVDTCCIDKTSSAELSEAINSMYRWYAQAEICFAFLSDVDSIADLATSLWFTRGWTLQELIAPKVVRFYNKTWQFFGSKAGLQNRLSTITRIPPGILRGQKLTQCSIAQRMSWAADRITTRPEDMAYCLMGLFEVNMPMLYGEGHHAFTRLQQEIISVSDDQSIFAWSTDQPGRRGILAPSSKCFRDCGNLKSTANVSAPHEYAITNVGLSISLPLIPWAMNIYLAILQCVDVSDFKHLMPQYRHDARSLRNGIFIRSTGRDGRFVRTTFEGEDVHHVNLADNQKNLSPVPIFLLQRVDECDDSPHLYGFLFRRITSVLFTNSSHGADVPFIKCREPPVEAVWTSGRWDDVQRWLQRENLDLSSEGVRELLRKRRYDRWHSREWAEAEFVRMVEIPHGSQGAVATLYANNDSHTTPEGQKAFTSYLKSITFGFDFHCNPVCVLRSTAKAQWNKDPVNDSTYEPSITRTDLSDFEDCQELDTLIRLSEVSRENSWNEKGIMAIRGQRAHGLAIELPTLNIRIDISEGWEDKFMKAWIVDIAAIHLPSVFDQEFSDKVSRQEREARWKLAAEQRDFQNGSESSASTNSAD